MDGDDLGAEDGTLAQFIAVAVRCRQHQAANERLIRAAPIKAIISVPANGAGAVRC